MSSTTTDQKFLDAKATLREPHFNEEATVLSARPVVPLEEVRSLRTGTPLTRPWILGLSLAGALLVGVFATVIYYSRSSEDSSSVLEGIELTSGAGGISDDPVNSFSGPASPQPKPETVAVVKAAPEDRQPDRATAKSGKNSRPRLVAVIRDRKSNNHIEDAESSEDRKAARRQARRDRRRADRERRDGKSSDELLRIRDIFEGSPRP